MLHKKSFLFVGFLLVCYGLGIFLLHYRQTQEQWIPKISFNLPAFMYNKTIAEPKDENDPATKALPLAEPSNAQKIHVLFSKTPLKQIKLKTPWNKETQAYKTYAKPFDILPNKRKLAVVFTGLGLDDEVLKSAEAMLPDSVTFSFSSYAPDLLKKVQNARKEGFETMLNIPVETNDFPRADAGPNAFYAFASEEENKNTLNHLFKQNIPFVGFLSPRLSQLEGTTFFQNLVETDILTKGLMYVGNTDFRKKNKLIHIIDLTVLENLYPQALHVFFNEAEAIAKEEGDAILVLSPLPGVFQEVADWISMNENPDIQFVPISAITGEPLNE